MFPGRLLWTKGNLHMPGLFMEYKSRWMKICRVAKQNKSYNPFLTLENVVYGKIELPTALLFLSIEGRFSMEHMLNCYSFFPFVPSAVQLTGKCFH